MCRMLVFSMPSDRLLFCLYYQALRNSFVDERMLTFVFLNIYLANLRIKIELNVILV